MEEQEDPGASFKGTFTLSLSLLPLLLTGIQTGTPLTAPVCVMESFGLYSEHAPACVCSSPPMSIWFYLISQPEAFARASSSSPVGQKRVSHCIIL